MTPLLLVLMLLVIKCGSCWASLYQFVCRDQTGRGKMVQKVLRHLRSHNIGEVLE